MYDQQHIYVGIGQAIYACLLQCCPMCWLPEWVLFFYYFISFSLFGLVDVVAFIGES